ncbi:MAG: molybdopterin molybdotransferase MoeA [Clostridiales Family XIII bacterium]|jgi:molybdopterin molybdotransferase/putative molybdopterin biosynthesis protein|nr:molybdopterin molybdotransferase MoeA [Clostridiales Family XIII bacterium]
MTVARIEFDTLTREEALEKLFARWQPAARAEPCALAEARGRILAEDVLSVSRQPVFRASRMDGIAVRAADFAERPLPDTRAFREGEDYVRADTGDDFDDRFDAVVPIEDVMFFEGGGLALAQGLGIEPGMNIEPGGQSLREGDVLARAGQRLRPIDIATITRGGLTQVSVRKRPVACFIPTGSELAEPGVPLRRGQVTDANSSLAQHMLAEMGAEVALHPIVRDRESELEAALDEALAVADIVVINGGSSKGKDDCNASLLKRRGEVICHGVAAAPGRPVCITLIDGKPAINVPGPTIASYYVFDWCLRAVIARALGIQPEAKELLAAELTEDLHTPAPIEFLNRLNVFRSGGRYFATPLTLDRASSEYVIGAGAAQYINKIGEAGFPKGSSIEVELLCPRSDLPDR